MQGFITHEKLAKQIGDDISWARQYRDERTENWKALYALYKNYLDETTYPWRARLAIPTAHTIVEVQVPIITDMIFESGDFVSVLGKTPKGQVSAPAVQKVLNHHFTHSFRIYEDLEQFIRQLLIYGTSVYKCYWQFKQEHKTRIVPEYQGEGLPIKYNKETKREITANRPTGHPVDIWNFGIDPNSSGPVDARFAFEEMWLDLPHLISLHQMDIIEKKVIDQLMSSDPVDTDLGLQDRYGHLGMEGHQKSPTKARGQFHCVDYWGYVTKEGKNEEFTKGSQTQLIHSLVCMSANAPQNEGAPLVLFSEPTPFYHNQIPFVASRLDATIGEFYGVGDLEYCESLLIEQRDLRNIHMDNLSQALNNMWKVMTGAGVNENELITRPNGIIHLQQMDAVESLDRRPLDPAYFATENSIRADIETSTGVNDFVMGSYRSSTGFNDTATGISLIQEMALKRIGHKGQIVQRAIRDIGEQAFMLLAQFNPMGHTARVLDQATSVGWKFLSLSPQDMAESYDFNIVNTPSLGSKQARTQQLFQAIQLAMQTEVKTGQVLDYRAALKMMFDEIGIQNSAALLGHPQFNPETLPLLMESGEDVPASLNSMIPPEEENRLMQNGEAVHAKMGEDHPNHRLVHKLAFDESEDPNYRGMVAKHDKEHAELMVQEKSLLAQAAATQLQQQAMDQQAEKIDAAGKGTKSQGAGAQGQEAMMRGMGGMLSGNG